MFTQVGLARARDVVESVQGSSETLRWRGARLAGDETYETGGYHYLGE